jgi:hypothetical protein
MSKVTDELYESKMRLKELGVTGMSTFLSPDAKDATVDDMAKDLLIHTSLVEKLIVKEKKWKIVEKYVPFVKSIRKKNRDKKTDKMFGK